jgi:hypothetical protein
MNYWRQANINSATGFPQRVTRWNQYGKQQVTLPAQEITPGRAGPLTITGLDKEQIH